MRAGKIRYIGCSNFSGWHLMKSLAVSERYGWPRYVAHQAYYSLVGRDYEWELMPLALDQKVGAVVWSPLGWGRLTGKIRRGQPLPETSRLHEKPRRIGPPVADEYLYRVVDALDEVAAETGKTVPQIALNWLLQRPTSRRDHRRAQRGAAARESRRGRLDLTPSSRQARRSERRTPAYPYWHQGSSRAQSAAGVSGGRFGARDRRLEPGGRPRDRRLHDRPTLALKVTRSSSSCANVSGIPPSIPAMAASRASFEG